MTISTTTPDEGETRLQRKMRLKLMTWATEAHPREACGVVCGTRDRPLPIRLPNIAKDAQKAFEVDQADLAYTVAEHGMPWAVWHSHPSGDDRPSETDYRVHPPQWAMIIVTTGSVQIYDD